MVTERTTHQIPVVTIKFDQVTYEQSGKRTNQSKSALLARTNQGKAKSVESWMPMGGQAGKIPKPSKSGFDSTSNEQKDRISQKVPFHRPRISENGRSVKKFVLIGDQSPKVPN
jgi:hypothetical protein